MTRQHFYLAAGVGLLFLACWLAGYAIASSVSCPTGDYSCDPANSVLLGGGS